MIKKIYTIITGVVALPISIIVTILTEIHLLKFYSTCYIISNIPGTLGVLTRRFSYKLLLKKCGKNLFMDIGSVITYKETILGDNIFIGPYSKIDLAEIGNDTMISYDVVISGSKNAHGTAKKGLIRLQKGEEPRKITIGEDVWVGTRAVVFEDIKKGTIVASTSLVNKIFSEYSIVAGIPAKIIGKRK